MMKKLFLASFFSGVASAFPAFAGDCAGKKVVFIPTASLPEKVAFYVGSDRKALIKLGMAVEDLEISAAAPELNGDFNALGVTSFSVVPHCANAPFKKAAEKIIAQYADTLDLRPIANHQALTVDGDKVDVISAEVKKKAAKEKK